VLSSQGWNRYLGVRDFVEVHNLPRVTQLGRQKTSERQAALVPLRNQIYPTTLRFRSGSKRRLVCPSSTRALTPFRSRQR
jgi:hypothetical protein